MRLNWTFPLPFACMRSVMRNVALNGKRSFLICIHSAEDRFSESANKRMQSNRQTAKRFADR